MSCYRLPLWGIFPALLFGCATHAPKPSPPVPDAAAQFTTEIAATTQNKNQAWWETALPPELASGIHAMLHTNTEVRAAATAVAAQKARLQFADTDKAWRLDGNAGAAVQTDNSERSTTVQVGLDALLPLDWSKRLENTRDAAAFDLAQSLAQLEQTRLEQVELFLLSHIDAAESAQLAQLLQQQIKTAQTLLNLTEFRFSQGLVSSVDVLQQREQLAALKQQPVEVELRIRQARSQLALLRGQLPAHAAAAPEVLPAIARDFAVVIPADLLNRRPDLIAKRAALLASDKRYAALLSEYLPDATLSASALLRLASGDPSAIFGTALDASLRVFDSGRLDARSEAQRALLEGAGIDYLSAWLEAVRQTDDLAQTLTNLDARLQLSEKQTEVATALFDATRRRYERGISDYLPVLAALRSLQQQQRDHLALQAERLRVIVRLHGSMGLPMSGGLPMSDNGESA